jgi:hypothetical protein
MIIQINEILIISSDMIARVHIRVYYKGKTHITHDACTLQKLENQHILSLSNPVLWYQIFLFEIRRGACGGSECVRLHL